MKMAARQESEVQSRLGKELSIMRRWHPGRRLGWGIRCVSYIVVGGAGVRPGRGGLQTGPLYSTDVEKGDFPVGRRNILESIFKMVHDSALDSR
jgi:hypothetical protein